MSGTRSTFAHAVGRVVRNPNALAVARAEKICVGGLCRRVCVGKVCVEFVSGRAIDVAVVVAVAVMGRFDSDPVTWDTIPTKFLTSCCSESERLTLVRKVTHVSNRPRHSGYIHSPSVTHGSRCYECLR